MVLKGIELRGVPVILMLLNGIELSGIELSGMELSGSLANSIELSGMELRGMELNGLDSIEYPFARMASTSCCRLLLSVTPSSPQVKPGKPDR